MAEKKFGLIMPKKAESLKTRVSSIFNDDSDDEEKVNKRPKIPQKKMTQKKSIKTESDIDPSIYEYDSIYDEMKTKEAEKHAPKEAKKSRYIDTLLKAADKRKKEYERRIDKKIQSEREKEGDQFKDKEAFVTSAYKKKLLEKEEEEERERRENMLNEMMDVTKQKDLSGFYRHFLNQTIGEEKIPLFGEKQIKKEAESEEDSTLIKAESSHTAENIDQDSDGVEIDNEDDDSERDFSDSKECDNKRKKEKISRKNTVQFRNRRRSDTKENLDDDTSESIQKSGSPVPGKKSKSAVENLDQDSDGIEIDNEDDDSERDFSDSKDSDNERKKAKISRKNTVQFRNRKRTHMKENSDDDTSESIQKSGSLMPGKRSKSDADSDTNLAESENNKTKKKAIHSVKHKDTTKSVSSNTTDSENDEVVKKTSHSQKVEETDKSTVNKRSRHDSSSSNDEHDNESSNVNLKPELSREEKQRNIYAKRTVGDVFAEAQARYFQRMAVRNSGT